MESFFSIRRTLGGLAVWGGLVAAATLLAGRGAWTAGFLLGWLGCLVYYLLLCRRVQQAVRLPAQQAVRSMRVGWLVRLLFLLLLLLLSVRLEGISFWAAVAGLFSLQAVLLLTGAAFGLKRLLPNRGACSNIK